MLKKFSVTNYRQFHERLEFDLTASNYAFNQDCVKDDLVKLALIYGENGTGKSNLGWAMYDLISHLTDNEANENKPNYLNAFSNDKYATFKFEFLLEIFLTAGNTECSEKQHTEDTEGFEWIDIYIF